MPPVSASACCGYLEEITGHIHPFIEFGEVE